MKFFNAFAYGFVAFAVTAAFNPAHAENIATPGNPDGWVPANVRANAAVAITGTYKPAGETGSLQFTTNTIVNGQDKADFAHALNGTLGDLVNNQGAKLSYDYFVSSTSTTASHFAPAFRLGFRDQATGKSGYLIYEPVYNGSPVGTGVQKDTWVTNDLKNANFWMRTFSPGNTIEQYSVTLADWASGVTFPNSYQLSANTQILGVEVGVGSGWGNAFNGAVDHVNVNFGRSGTQGVSTNFEAVAVPEPATWAMMIGGFGLIGAASRRRSRTIQHAIG